MSKCIGCGITLQNTNTNKVGYTKKLDNKYCERCFKTIHYNEFKKVENIENEKIIAKINKLKLMTIFITDLLSINEKLLSVFKMIKNKKVLVINKCDLIPNNFKLEHLEKNIKDSYDLDCDIVFISAKKEYNLNSIIRIISNNEKIIICGETSSGKSTLINKLIGSSLTTSKYNNTTLDFIKLKYEEFVIYDTPGLIINTEKEYSEKIVLKTRRISNDYVLMLDDIKINGNGNITVIQNELLNIKSKKDNTKLDKTIVIPSNSDIVLTNGFIYIKEGLELKTNNNIEVRKSIIGR